MNDEKPTLIVKDSVLIKGNVPEVYAYLWNARAWPLLNPHVKTVEMLDEGPTYQHMRMEVESDGKMVAMETKRNGMPPQSISYDQTQPPPFFKEHRGLWELQPESEGVKVTLTHTVRLDEERIKKFLNVDSLEEARSRVAAILSRNGLRTIEAIKKTVEAENEKAELMT